MPPANIVQQMINTQIIKAHTIDNATLRNSAKQARLRVTRLRAWRYRTYFHKTKTQCAQGINVIGIFVQPGGQPHTVSKADTQYGNRIIHGFAGIQRKQAELMRELHALQGEMVSALGIQRKQ